MLAAWRGCAKTVRQPFATAMPRTQQRRSHSASFSNEVRDAHASPRHLAQPTCASMSCAVTHRPPPASAVAPACSRRPCPSFACMLWCSMQPDVLVLRNSPKAASRHWRSLHIHQHTPGRAVHGPRGLRPGQTWRQMRTQFSLRGAPARARLCARGLHHLSALCMQAK